MTHQEIINGLKQLGFFTGWAVSEETIILWENSEPQPSEKQLSDAAKLWEKTLLDQAEAKAVARAAILNRLGLTAEEAEILLS